MVHGLETFIKNEVDFLDRRGHEVRLFVTKLVHSAGFEPSSGIGITPPQYSQFIKGNMLALGNRVGFWALLREAIQLGGIVEFFVALSWLGSIKQFRADLIHAAFGDRKFFVAYFVHRMTGTPLTVAIHAHEIYAQPNPKLFRHALGYTRSVVTISNKNSDILINSFGVQPEKIRVIKLPVDTAEWKPRRSKYVLSVARFTPRKGWDVLVDAAAMLGPEYQFLAVGFGDLDVLALAQSKGVASHFTVFPKLSPDNIRVLMDRADVFCLASKPTEDEGSEGIPVVLMEAMSMGLPIVTTDDGSTTELVTDYVVKPGDAHAFADAIRKASPSDTYERKIEQANVKRVRSMHSPENALLLEDFFIKCRASDNE